MANGLMVALFMFMALLIGNKIGHDAGRAIASEHCSAPPRS